MDGQNMADICVLKRRSWKKQFNEQSVSGPPIFGGVSIYVNGYTDPPASALRDLIIRHGGRYQAYYSRHLSLM
ncbi:unnamed protein product [Heterobilharzia americana]|nr:unnamed protein product [Heterobilharzia americana]